MIAKSLAQSGASNNFKPFSDLPPYTVWHAADALSRPAREEFEGVLASGVQQVALT